MTCDDNTVYLFIELSLHARKDPSAMETSKVVASKFYLGVKVQNLARNVTNGMKVSRRDLSVFAPVYPTYIISVSF